MISQADDLLKRAVECDRLMKLDANPTWQTMFRFMRDMWLEQANETSMNAQKPAREVAAVEQMPRDFEIRQDDHTGQVSGGRRLVNSAAAPSIPGPD
jgi:hypothetical protein